MKDSYITSLVYGRLFKIVSKHDVLPDSYGYTDVLVDLGRDILENYFYTLYIKDKKELGDGMYKLSDWKRDNKHITDIYDYSTRSLIGGKIETWLEEMDLITIKTKRI